ncbi:restriction endonuclease subunit S [Elizabethkingia anophelis]|uniref:restriction endonuclease subunit S n=1 Tax=Elizabethkingia TaxID=308865 RepID=UPI0019045A57|nr:restriction endonuclease subunit S [Elizabethkingia sp. M8]MCT3946321.1 restriction endonuclease subunit S [Elizabethkingia anophelis]MCT3995934.1 restriction endonuclease subunit S [Elizabethkingia anophelis]MCT3999502.1 restriction endonuclease subunit S [Elizabethkingia anophelis]MCT4191669.1 restriction endonuclease subunit S [Elizabethkingia anophelis]MCT4256028.1 restriction endonuclease subunit S [Elizabethkingia anophelis]
MTKISLNNIDKSKWISYPFEKIAKRISESVDPNKTDLAVYIGLEHLDAETVHIRRHGSPSDVSGGKLKCYPGDIIFGKRRAYQRKAGIVEQEGICSAHSFVFRANEDVISARLFPFFLHSDQFMHRMVDISVGGLSPTINWSDLKHQEFLLPPKDEQAELADLLWAMDDVIEKDLKVLGNFEVLLESNLKKLFNSKKELKLIDLCIEKPKYGSNTSATSYDSKTRYIRITDIGKLNNLNNEKVSSENPEDKYLLEYGDFLLARSADPGRSYYYLPEHGRCIYAGYLIKFKLNLKIINPAYLYLYTQTNKFRIWINQTTRKGTLSNINSEEFGKISVPYVSIDEQIEIVNSSQKTLNQLTLIESKLQSSKALQKSLINQIF